jgi:hypothetical protein
MSRIRSFLKNINLLNLLLTVTIIVFANYTLFLMFVTKMKYALPSVAKSMFSEDAPLDEPSPASPSDYIIVSEDNLFHPERRIPPEKKEEVPLPKPEFVLYGTLITLDSSLAYLEDLKAPRITPGRGQRQITMKKGDMMSGFILKDVQPDKIVMVRGEENMIIRVHNPNRLKKQDVSTPVQPGLRSSSVNIKPEDIPSIVEPRSKATRRAPMKPADEKTVDFFNRQRK